MVIKDRLRARRAELGHLQADAARAMGVHKNSVSNWECGTPVRTVQLKAVAEYLGITVQELFNTKENHDGEAQE